MPALCGRPDFDEWECLLIQEREKVFRKSSGGVKGRAGMRHEADDELD